MNDGVTDEKDLARFMLRLPASLRDRVAARAKARGHSMNTEIVAILEEALDGLSGARLRDLSDDYRRIKESCAHLALSLEQAEQQKMAIEREIFDRIKRVEMELPPGDKLTEETLRLIGRSLK